MSGKRNNPLITYKEFGTILNKIRDITDAEAKISEMCIDLNHKYKESSQAGYLPNMASDVIHLLEIILNDESEWISYWCWEKDFGRDPNYNVYDEDGSIIPFTTVHDLWNYLTKK